MAQLPARLLEFREVAEYLHVSAPTLYRLIKSRQLPAYKVGGKWKFKPEDIERFLEQHSNFGAAEEEMRES